jgi:uncharacterized protein with WD repeat
MVTYTKTMRSKRVDVRPNAAQRKIVSKRVEKSKTIQDIRVTKSLTKNERIPQASELRKPRKSETDKYLFSLRKKLKDIDVLMERQNQGEKLNEAQLTKIDRLSQLLKELESFTAAEEEPDRNTGK